MTQRFLLIYQVNGEELSMLNKPKTLGKQNDTLGDGWPHSTAETFRPRRWNEAE